MVSFRFTNDTVPQALYQDLQFVNGLNVAQLEELLTLLMSFISGETSVDLLEQVPSFAAQHSLNATQLKNCVRAFVYFFKNALRVNLSPPHLKEDLVNFGIGDESASRIAQAWKNRFAAMSRSLIGQTLMVNQLIDMEWKFGVTAANSDMAKVGSSYLQIKLVLDKGNQTTEDVFLELSLPQFYEFLSQMQKAKSSLEFFS
jgi:hypothetical protein